MNSTMTQTGVGIIEKISLTQPILALLLLAFIVAIFYLYKEKNKKEAEIKELRAASEAEIKEQNKLLLTIQDRITTVIYDYKNAMDNLIEIENKNKDAIERNNQIINNLILKIEYVFQKQ